MSCLIESLLYVRTDSMKVKSQLLIHNIELAIKVIDSEQSLLQCIQSLMSIIFHYEDASIAKLACNALKRINSLQICELQDYNTCQFLIKNQYTLPNKEFCFQPLNQTFIRQLIDLYIQKLNIDQQQLMNQEDNLFVSQTQFNQQKQQVDNQIVTMITSNLIHIENLESIFNFYCICMKNEQFNKKIHEKNQNSRLIEQISTICRINSQFISNELFNYNSQICKIVFNRFRDNYAMKQQDILQLQKSILLININQVDQIDNTKLLNFFTNFIHATSQLNDAQTLNLLDILFFKNTQTADINDLLINSDNQQVHKQFTTFKLQYFSNKQQLEFVINLKQKSQQQLQLIRGDIKFIGQHYNLYEFQQIVNLNHKFPQSKYNLFQLEEKIKQYFLYEIQNCNVIINLDYFISQFDKIPQSKQNLYITNGNMYHNILYYNIFCNYIANQIDEYFDLQTSTKQSDSIIIINEDILVNFYKHMSQILISTIKTKLKNSVLSFHKQCNSNASKLMQ